LLKIPFRAANVRRSSLVVCRPTVVSLVEPDFCGPTTISSNCLLVHCLLAPPIAVN
jgi:hypothetical protein